MKYAIVLTCMFCSGCGGGVTPDETVLTDAGSEEPTDCTGTQPATMVLLPEGYSIDSTEVTRCQYKAWLDTNPSTEGQDPWCSWNESFVPWDSDSPELCGWPPNRNGSLPVICLDWCDAFAYCKDLGRRLCGRIGGGPNNYESVADRTMSQWFNACTSAGKYTYPYGNTYDDGSNCNDADREKAPKHLTPAGSLPGCQSPDLGYSGVFDLSGNVWEWEDSCNKNSTGQDLCRIRGGSNGSSESYGSCGFDMGAQRMEANHVMGFRCCSNP